MLSNDHYTKNSRIIRHTGTAIPVNVPSTQTYKENSFGPGANLAAGKAAQLEGLQFHNLAGILALQLKQGAAATSVSAIRICSYDDAPLHGSAVIDGWLRGLSNEDRTLFLRRYWNGEPLAAIARERGVTPGSLAQRALRLRLSLRARLEEEGISL